MSVKAVSPRMLVEFARAPEDVLVIYELGLVGLYAGLSKLFRTHKVVSLVKGDYRHIGQTGSAPVKVALRRFGRFVDAFVANNLPARDYLIQTLKVPDDKIVIGWWLAGCRPLVARLPNAPPVPDGMPLFVSAGRLIPLKGVDLLIRALAVYRREFGPCVLWVIGEGPERHALLELSAQLRVQEDVNFLGTVDRGSQGRLPGVQRVRVPDAAGLRGAGRGRGTEHRRADRHLADDGSRGHDRAGRRERDRGGPAGRTGIGRGDEARSRPADRARPPRGRPANERAPAAGCGHRGDPESCHPGAGRIPHRSEVTSATVDPYTVDDTEVQVAENRGSRSAGARSPRRRARRGCSQAEILATLDGRGELESLPFMPEMLEFCGERSGWTSWP